MDQQNQLKKTRSNGKTAWAVASSVLLTALIAGTGVYFWQQSAQAEKVEELEHEIASLNQQIYAMETSQAGVQPTPADQQPEAKTFAIPEVGLTASFPDNYSLTKNNEPNRRGSFVSYDFQRAGDHQTPHLAELQFFSEESIRNFIDSCGGALCFEGDYPDPTRYEGQKSAFAQGKDYETYRLQSFGDRNWFVSSLSCVGDSCIIREYTTFLGDIKLDVWIMMADSSEEQEADALFAQFAIQ